MGSSLVTDPLIGSLIDGRYRVESQVARGGMGAVYEATDCRLDRRVAVKVLPPVLAHDDTVTERFVREAHAAARLSSPNIVTVYDQGHDGNVVFLVMEYVPGRVTLRSVIREYAPLPALRALALFEDVVAALATAHDAGIVHRDIKPENVLLTPQGQVKVADFGLARALSAAAGAASTDTGGVLMGTVGYLPPELVTDGVADARSDVYSLGVLLFELLTGRKPHEGETALSVAYKHVHDDVPAPSSLAPGIPLYVDALVARATARLPEMRPADAGRLLDSVRRVRRFVASGASDDPQLTTELATQVTADSTTDSTTDLASTLQVPTPRQPFPSPSPPYPAHQAPGPPAGPPAGATASPAARPPVQTTTGAFAAPPSAAALPATDRRARGWLALIFLLLLAVTAALSGWHYGVGLFH